jgi:hypothetical protein
MKRAAARRGRRGKRRGSSGASFDVLALRQALGRPHGLKAASRSMLAELIGASEGSVLNWEKGKPPTEKYASKLRELSDQAKKGTVTLPHRNRGGRRPSGKTARAVAAGTPRGRPGRPRKIALTGSSVVLYANHVSVDTGSTDALVRFALVLPGQAGARAVADVMVPRDVLSTLRI